MDLAVQSSLPSSFIVAKEAEGMYPATEKEVIRNHISYICRKQHCADTFVLYLNSPTRNDGTMLLWDRNNNGIVSLWDSRNITNNKFDEMD